VAEKGRFALRIVSLVGEEGQDLPPPQMAQAEALAPAPAAAVPPIAAAFATPEPEAQSEQPPEADPFNLDELL
jgi:flagellar motor switch protein FliN/FliY